MVLNRKFFNVVHSILHSPCAKNLHIKNGPNFKAFFDGKQIFCRYYSTSNVTQAAATVKKMVKPSTSSSFTKDKLNIGTIGHIDHGKTTLTAAITKVLSEKGLARFSKFEDIDRAAEEQKRGITIFIAHINYESQTRSYNHTDCPGHKDFIKNMICGASQMDAAVLVIAATDGAMPQTKEHLMLAKRCGVENIIVFINKCDKVDNEMLDLVELEARDLLTEFGFNGDAAPVIRGSALCALEDAQPEIGRKAILQLIETLDALPLPSRDTDGPLLMPVQSILNVTGRGTVAIGTLERGSLKKGDTVEILGYGKTVKCVATDMQIFNKSINEVKAGDHVGVLCRGVKKDDLRRGYWLTTPGSVQLRNAFRAECYVMTPEEGGRDAPIRSGYSQPIRCTTWEQCSRVLLPENVDMLMPGDHGTANFYLLRPMPLEKGIPFTLSRSSRDTVVSGKVSELLPNTSVSNFDDLSVLHFEDGKLVMKKERKK